MTETIEQCGPNLADRLYSIKEAAKELRRSESSIKDYKKILLQAFEKDRALVVGGSGSLTQYGMQQLRVVQTFFACGEPNEYVRQIWTEFPELASDQADQLASSQGGTLQVNALAFRDDPREVVEAEIIDDGSEYSEQSAIALKKQKNRLAKAQTRALGQLGGLRNRIKAVIKAEIVSVGTEAVEEALEELGLDQAFDLGNGQ